MKLKEAKTFSEQVDCLIDKNIVVKNKDECEQLLHSINYYRLSAYYLPFRGADGRCKNPTPLEKITEIYTFDKDLRTLIFLITEDIEIYLKTQLAYYSGHTYGPDGYLDKLNYHPSAKFNKLEEHFNEALSNNKNTPVVKHHKAKYGGILPVWVHVEFLTLGTLSHFYRDMKNTDKTAIAQKLYSINYQTLNSWIKCLTVLRNLCAHHSRLYYTVFTSLPKQPKGDPHKPTRRLFSQIYMLKLMYPSKRNWNRTVLPILCRYIDNHSEAIDLKHIGFPVDWQDLLINKEVY